MKKWRSNSSYSKAKRNLKNAIEAYSFPSSVSARIEINRVIVEIEKWGTTRLIGIIKPDKLSTILVEESMKVASLHKKHMNEFEKAVDEFLLSAGFVKE